MSDHFVYARAKVPFGGATIEAELLREGWRCRSAVLEDLLNRLAMPSRDGECGRPMVAAANQAREVFHAEVELTPIDKPPLRPNAVY